MKRILVRCLTWLLRKLGYRDVPVSAPVRTITVAALPLVLALEDIKDVSGEYKLSQVYGRLVKVFPASDRDDISFAIILAVRRMKGKMSWR